MFLKNKITYQKYLEITGKDKLITEKQKNESNKTKEIVKSNNEDDQYYKYSKLVLIFLVEMLTKMKINHI